MRELALNILDIVENSVKAQAKLVTVEISAEKNMLSIKITDDGCGMDKEMLNKVSDPYTTSRKTRNVGLGIPFFKQSAEMANGSFEIFSKYMEGTSVIATFEIDHIDRAPLGDLSQTIVTLLNEEIETEFLFKVEIDGEYFEFDTRELKAELNGISVSDPNVIVFVRDMINENLTQIGGEKL